MTNIIITRRGRCRKCNVDMTCSSGNPYFDICPHCGHSQPNGFTGPVSR